MSTACCDIPTWWRWLKIEICLVPKTVTRHNILHTFHNQHRLGTESGEDRHTQATKGARAARTVCVWCVRFLRGTSLSMIRVFVVCSAVRCVLRSRRPFRWHREVSLKTCEVVVPSSVQWRSLTCVCPNLLLPNWRRHQRASCWLAGCFRFMRGAWQRRPVS